MRIINRIIRSYRPRRVLELAPGPARLSTEVIGFETGCLCDINIEMLAVARTRVMHATRTGQRLRNDGKWHIATGDALSLPFNRTFDLVYTFRFIRHFEHPIRATVYHQIHSLLKPGGIFVFDAVNAHISRPLRATDGEAQYPIYDELYERDTLVAEMTRHGFHVLSLLPVMRHASLQRSIQIHLGSRSYRIAKYLIQWCEYLPGPPLEWVVVCQKPRAV